MRSVLRVLREHSQSERVSRGRDWSNHEKLQIEVVRGWNSELGSSLAINNYSIKPRGILVDVY